VVPFDGILLKGEAPRFVNDFDYPLSSESPLNVGATAGKILNVTSQFPITVQYTPLLQ
jgi:hypothetical protein